MSERSFEEYEKEVEYFSEKIPTVAEPSLSKRLERRRKIEDLFEERKLQAELAEFG